MQVVKVKKAELLARLEENLAGHGELFEKALTGYRKIVIYELEKIIGEARRGGEIKTSVYLQAPEDHRKDYETAIQMLRMSVDDEVEITNREFRQFMLDDWDWKVSADFTNNLYASGRRPDRRP